MTVMPFNEEKDNKCGLILGYVQVRGWPSRRCQHQHPGAQSAEGDHACDWDPDLLQLIEVLHLSFPPSLSHGGTQTGRQ